jgi:hypothetical protein
LAVLKKKELPDRVYGLRETNNFKFLLHSADKRAPLDAAQRLLRETLKSSPFRQDGEPLLFPFLVLEAKSGKGKDHFDSIEMQTAFVIRALLQLQHGLQLATGEDTSWSAGPLVWFLSSKGEQWQIASSFVEYEDESTFYYVS